MVTSSTTNIIYVTSNPAVEYGTEELIWLSKESNTLKAVWLWLLQAVNGAKLRNKTKVEDYYMSLGEEDITDGNKAYQSMWLQLVLWRRIYCHWRFHFVNPHGAV